MSVIFNQEQAGYAKYCFYCSKTLSFPCIHWAGEYEIFLHSDCVEELFEKLKLDVMEARGEI